jgi:hypothetical protein
MSPWVLSSIHIQRSCPSGPVQPLHLFYRLTHNTAIIILGFHRVFILYVNKLFLLKKLRKSYLWLLQNVSQNRQCTMYHLPHMLAGSGLHRVQAGSKQLQHQTAETEG